MGWGEFNTALGKQKYWFHYAHLQTHRGSKQTESIAALLGKKITDGVYISMF